VADQGEEHRGPRCFGGCRVRVLREPDLAAKREHGETGDDDHRGQQHRADWRRGPPEREHQPRQDAARRGHQRGARRRPFDEQREVQEREEQRHAPQRRRQTPSPRKARQAHQEQDACGALGRERPADAARHERTAR
jgi:hypothetical protein